MINEIDRFVLGGHNASHFPTRKPELHGKEYFVKLPEIKKYSKIVGRNNYNKQMNEYFDSYMFRNVAKSAETIKTSRLENWRLEFDASAKQNGKQYINLPKNNKKEENDNQSYLKSLLKDQAIWNQIREREYLSTVRPHSTPLNHESMLSSFAGNVGNGNRSCYYDPFPKVNFHSLFENESRFKKHILIPPLHNTNQTYDSKVLKPFPTKKHKLKIIQTTKSETHVVKRPIMVNEYVQTIPLRSNYETQCNS
jgi:hypothetical protein